MWVWLYGFCQPTQGSCEVSVCWKLATVVVSGYANYDLIGLLLHSGICRFLNHHRLCDAFPGLAFQCAPCSCEVNVSVPTQSLSVDVCRVCCCVFMSTYVSVCVCVRVNN